MHKFFNQIILQNRKNRIHTYILAQVQQEFTFSSLNILLILSNSCSLSYRLAPFTTKDEFKLTSFYFIYLVSKPFVDQCTELGLTLASASLFLEDSTLELGSLRQTFTSCTFRVFSIPNTQIPIDLLSNLSLPRGTTSFKKTSQIIQMLTLKAHVHSRISLYSSSVQKILSNQISSPS